MKLKWKVLQSSTSKSTQRNKWNYSINFARAEKKNKSKKNKCFFNGYSFRHPIDCGSGQNMVEIVDFRVTTPGKTQKDREKQKNQTSLRNQTISDFFHGTT